MGFFKAIPRAAKRVNSETRTQFESHFPAQTAASSDITIDRGLTSSGVSTRSSAATSWLTNTSNVINSQVDTPGPSKTAVLQSINTDGRAAASPGYPNIQSVVPTEYRSNVPTCYCVWCLPYLTGKKIQYDPVIVVKYVEKIVEVGGKKVVMLEPVLVKDWVLRKE